jgi:hypothetical protein
MTSLGCTKNSSIRPNQNDEISSLETKIEKIKYEVPPELLRECQWLDPLDSNSRRDRVTTIKINTERHIECYLLNESKLKFLRELDKANNDGK